MAGVEIKLKPPVVFLKKMQDSSRKRFIKCIPSEQFGDT